MVDATAEEATGGGFGRRRGRRLVAIGLAVVLTPALVLAAFAAFIWIAGGIRGEFFRDALRDRVAASLPPGSAFGIGEAELTVDAASGLALSARDVAIELPGAARVHVAEARIGFDLGAALRGRLGTDTIDIAGVEVALDGASDLNLGGDRAEAVRRLALQAASDLAKLDDALAGLGVDRLEIADITLALPAALPTSLRDAFTRIDLVRWTPGPDGGSTVSVAAPRLALLLGDEVDSDGMRAITLEASGLDTATLAPALAAPGASPAFEAALELRLALAFGPEGQFDRLSTTASVGPGYLRAGLKDSTLVSRAEIGLELPSKGDALRIFGEVLASDARRFALDGMARLGDGGAPIRIASSVSATSLAAGGQIGLYDMKGALSATLDPDALELDIRYLDLAGLAGRFAIAGTYALGGDAPGLALAVDFGEMSAASALAFWPPWIAEDARDWAIGNIGGGTVGPASLRVALPPEDLGPASYGKPIPVDGLVGRIGFGGVRFTAVDGLPDAIDAGGAIHFAGGAALIELDRGGFDVPGHPRVAIGGSAMSVPNLGTLAPVGDLSLQLSGPAAAIAALSDSGPLKLASEKGFAARDLSGDASLMLTAEIPLSDAFETASIQPEFRLTLDDVASDSPIDGRRIADADLVIAGNLSAYTIEGDAEIDGVFTRIAMLAGDAGRGANNFMLTLDEAQRQRLGIDAGEALDGVVTASVTDHPDGRQSVKLDLGRARLSLGPLGWEKGVGVPASADLALRKSPKGTTVDSFVLNGKSFYAKGSAVLDGGGSLSSLQLSDVALRKGERLNASVRKKGAGFAASVGGSGLDARGLIRSFGGKAEPGGAGSAPPLDLDLALTGVRVENGVTLGALDGAMSLSGGGVRTGKVKGTTGRRQPFSVDVRTEGNVTDVTIAADNAGQFLRAFDLYSKIEGGRLSLRFRGEKGLAGDGDGLLRIERFRLIDEKALAKLVEGRRPKPDGSAASADDTPNNMGFARLTIPFSKRGRTVHIGEATLSGALLGGTARGAINLDEKTMALSGTFIPAYGLNNIAGKIPLFGEIIGGGRNEGLVGITYKMTGPISDPKLRMNPISAIAPGIFRRIFEYR